MALTTEEQRFYDFAKNALPLWMPDGDEFLMGAAKMFGSVKTLIDYMFAQTLIGNAVGSTATTPDWLDQHARDRGTSRQLDEDDPTLRERLRNVADAVTRPSLYAAINAILVAAGINDPCGIVELPRDGAHGGTYTAMAGVGGTFAVVGTTVKFTPTVLPWPRPPYWNPTIYDTYRLQMRSTQLVISGAANAANDGTHPITGLENNAALYTDATAGAGADATVVWKVETLDSEGWVRDTFARAYSQRGYRSARVRPPRMVIILPFGSTATIEASVREMLRQKKAAGIAVTIERRLIP